MTRRRTRDYVPLEDLREYSIYQSCKRLGGASGSLKIIGALLHRLMLTVGEKRTEWDVFLASTC